MNNFDFEVCRKEIDSIKLSENQKRKLVSCLENADDEAEILEFVKPKSHFKSIALVASFLVMMLTATLFINMNYPVDTPSLRDFRMSVSLSGNTLEEKKEYEISDKATIVVVPDDVISEGKGEIKLTLLDFHIEGLDIDTVDISSENKNFITCTYREKSGDMNTEIMKSEYKKLNLDKVSYLGWMPSYDNILLAEKDSSKGYQEYLSDEINVDVLLKNGESFSKKILVDYDSDNNYIIRFKE